MQIAQTDSNLLRLTATEMISLLGRREITSTELVEAHIARIQQTHPDLNAVVVSLFDQARQQAADADATLASNTSQLPGALFGLPVTIKEFFDVQGTVTTAGIVNPDRSSAHIDAATVSTLREAGAIVLGKTNVPQLGLAIESDNPVYGRTNNPLDADRSPGGSSGGEAAIVAGFGSPLGLGSDGGGSIRIPSHFCGICGLKPTAGRLSMQGHWQLPSFPNGWSVPGPLARSVEDLELAMQCLAQPSTDPSIPPLPTSSMATVDIAKLRVGYYETDGFTTPSPAIRRAVQESVQRLTSSGATLIPFEPPESDEAWEVNLGLFYADAGKWIKRLLGKSPIDARVKRTLTTAMLPTAVRRSLPTILESIGQTSLARVLRQTRYKRLNAFDYQEIGRKQQAFRRRFFERWQNARLDALICPAFPTVAMHHNSPDMVLGYGYTFVYNLLGVPAGTVPVTKVAVGEESDRPSARDDFVQAQLRTEQQSSGLPVGVQVVGAHWQEHVVLAIMKSLHRAIA